MRVRSSLTLLVLSLLSLLWASSCFISRPFRESTFDVDEKSPQRGAAIRLSNPQVFTREALISDRLREARFIEYELRESKEDVFLPSIYRDVNAISALTSQLGIRFDPAAAIGFRSELERVERELELQRAGKAEEPPKPGGDRANAQSQEGSSAEADFEKVEKALAELITTTRTIMDSLNTRATQDARLSRAKMPPEDRYEALQSFRTRLRADLASTNLDDAHDVLGNALYRFQFRALVLPGEKKNKWGILHASVRAPNAPFKDIRLLYYTWLAHANQRLNRLGTKNELLTDPMYQQLGAETRLYDLAVIPREEGDRLSLAVMPGMGPILAAYAPGGARRGRAEELEGIWNKLQRAQAELGATSHRIAFRSRPDDDSACVVDAVRPDGSALDGDLGSDKLTAAFETAREILLLVPSMEAVTIGLEDRGFLAPSDVDAAVWTRGIVDELAGYTRAARAVYQAVALGSRHPDVPGVSPEPSNTEKGADQEESPTSFKKLTDGLSKWFDDTEEDTGPPAGNSPSEDEYEDSFEYEKPTSFGELIEVLRTECAWGLPRDASKLIEAVWWTIPLVFEKNIRTCETEDDADCYFKGHAFAYAAHPAEKNQRMSTVASAANSAQTALALAAAAPQSGVSLESGVSYARSAAGRVDGIEHSPLLVGFADGDDDHYGISRDPEPIEDGSRAERVAEFGWVFGPPVRFDPEGENLTLWHSVASHRVLADLSIPAWWPRVVFETRTGWVKNWYDEVDYLDHAAPSVSSRIGVELPRSRADLDALSDYLRRSIFNQTLRRTRVDSIVPARISRCRDSVDLLIYGVDLWRDPRVFFMNERQDQIQVLPDMSGLEVRIELGDMNLAEDQPTAPISVVTRLGSSTGAVQLSNVGCPEGSGGDPIPVFLTKHHTRPATPFALRVATQSIPLRYRAAKLGFRSTDAMGATEWVMTDAVRAGNLFRGQSPADEKAPLWRDDFAEVALMVVPREGAAAEVHPVPGRVVLYESAEQAKVKVAADQRGIDVLPAVVKFALPEHFLQAWPQLGTDAARTAALRARLGSSRVELTVEHTAVMGSALTVELGEPGSDRERYQKLRESNQKIRFSFEIEGERDLPEFHGEVDLKPE